MNTSGKFLSLNQNSEEFAAVLDLDLHEFPMPWSTLDWTSLNWAHHQLFGIKNQSELIGFALFNQVPGDDSVHLLKICLKIAARGGPVSQVFWASIIEEFKHRGIKSIYLEVESQNLRALGFYRKSGFTLLRIIKGYYSNGDDAHTMQLTL
jgi:[ribosomal protein S18]-alanine N-acetyltransferase